MAWFLTMVVAVVLVAVALELMLPATTASPRWRLWLGAQGRRLVRRLRHRPPPPPDPFEVLRLQSQLGSLSREIQQLQTDPEIIARVHKLEAARAAYDDLLDEACQLAGIEVVVDAPHDESTRWREEQQLAEHGWSW